MRVLILLSVLLLGGCYRNHCDNIVEYYEQFPIYTELNGEYEFIAYGTYTQVMSSCDCVRAANNEAGKYFDRVEVMDSLEREFHYRYPSYYECR